MFFVRAWGELSMFSNIYKKIKKNKIVGFLLLSYSVESDIYLIVGYGHVSRLDNSNIFPHWVPLPPKVLFLKHVDTMIKLNSVGPLPSPTLIYMWPCELATWPFGACF